MTPIVYLNRLLNRFDELSNGQTRLHRFHLTSIRDLRNPAVLALIGDEVPAAMIVCVGLGARDLGGVEDTTVFPTRGQVVKVRAPWIRSGYTRQIGDLNGGEGGERTYVIPRPDGEVILGGTRDINDWYPYPRASTAADILRRAAEICPDLVPAHARQSFVNATSISSTSVDDSPESPLNRLVIDSIVGFRPSRNDGICLTRAPDLSFDGNPKTAIIHNYGHGGAGWQCCWGTAEEAVDLALEAS
jgi:D-amino-acid oxidase